MPHRPQHSAAESSPLAEAETPQHWIFDQVGDLLAILSPGHRILDVNAAWTSATGWSRGRLVGAALADQLADPAQALDLPPAAGASAAVHLDLRRRVGEPLGLDGVARRGPGGELTLVLRPAADPALAEAQRALEAQDHRLGVALAAAGAAVVDLDYEQRSVWCSPQLAELVGQDLTYAEATRPVWPNVAAEDAPAVEATVRRWRQGRPTAPLEVRVRRPDGTERWVRLFSDVQRDAVGRLRRTISLVQDIDRQKRQELALIAAERQASAGAEAKAQFLANMSHEIRTPMNGVLGVLHLLKGHALTPESAALLDEALACGAMLQGLLDDVVDLSRIEAGQLELAPEPLDPRALVEGVAGLLRPQAERAGLALRVEAQDLPAWVLADPVRLRQCLFNLVGNAVKFTPVGGVVVRCAPVEGAEAPRLRFEVTDTGVGVPQAAQARLFERFHQADPSTTRRFGGSGLGLAITRRLVELMAGEISFVSTEGQGSTFWFELPLAVAAAPDLHPPACGCPLHGLRILLVEDNPTNRLVAGRLLERLGAQVSTAEDGEAGVAAALAERFDLILMDIQMPRLDGLAAARRLRAAPVAQPPIIALTANVLAHQRESYLAAGMSGVAAKPVDPAALLGEIARVLAAPAGAAETGR